MWLVYVLSAIFMKTGDSHLLSKNLTKSDSEDTWKVRSSANTPLSPKHKDKIRVKLARKYMNLDMKHVQFTDESRATTLAQTAGERLGFSKEARIILCIRL